MEIKFKSRYPVENISKISEIDKNNIDEIIIILNELTDLGWNFHQWSTSTPDFEIEDIEKAYPTYQSMSINEQEEAMDAFLDTLPKYYFIESFGHPEHGYLRSDTTSIKDCAQSNLNKAKRMLSCIHEWKYTHNNGHKTCALCHTFVPCTIEEAIGHYDKGSVKYNEHLTLYFHNQKALCECGSNQLFYHQHSMFDQNDYQCVQCFKFHPTKYKHMEHSSLHISPISDDYENASLTKMEKEHDIYHRMSTFGLTNRKYINSKIHKYIADMLLHYAYVERNQDIDSFVTWVIPFIEKYIDNSKIQIKENDVHIDIIGIENITINIKDKDVVVNYDLKCKNAIVEKETAEEIFSNIFNALLSNKTP